MARADEAITGDKQGSFLFRCMSVGARVPLFVQRKNDTRSASLDTFTVHGPAAVQLQLPLLLCLPSPLATLAAAEPARGTGGGHSVRAKVQNVGHKTLEIPSPLLLLVPHAACVRSPPLVSPAILLRLLFAHTQPAFGSFARLFAARA